jgi:F-type H+-transporting ATPase subunit gamma
MPSLKAIKTKIKSTGNLKKISRALEIISTIKLQKNKAKVESAKQYFLDLAKLIAEVSDKVNLFDATPTTAISKKLIIVVSSEKWLCAWLNSKITKLLSNNYSPATADVFVIGKKGYEFCKRSDYSIVWYINLKDEIAQSDITPLLVFLEEQGKNYDKIDILFNFFSNLLTQVASSFTLAPLSKESITEFLAQVWVSLTFNSSQSNKTFDLLEPSGEQVKLELQKQVRTYLITAMILQNKISEHASRMLAMKNAKDNCTKFIWSLTLQFNKLRQANITREISEITAAKIAME